MGFVAVALLLLIPIGAAVAMTPKSTKS